MIVKVYSDGGVLRYSYDTTKTGEMLHPAIEDVPPIKDAMQEALDFLPKSGWRGPRE